MQYRGLFVGLTTIDIQYFVDSFPESNKKVKTNPPEILIGGPATNAAAVFSVLNQGAFLASSIGESPFNSFCQNDFKNTEVSHFDLAGKQVLDPVIASVVTSVNSGERNIFTHNPNNISPELTAKELFENTNPEILLLDSFYPKCSIECAKIAKSKNIPVIMDGGSWKPQFDTLLNYTDVIICSNDFIPPNCNNSKDVVDYLRKREIKNIAISRGEKSILFYSTESSGEIPVSKINVIDTLGAGDFLHGAFCYFYLQENDFRTALTKASEIASFSCQHKGTRSWLKLLKNRVALY